MTVQTTYNSNTAIGIPGMIAEQFSQRQIDTSLAENTSIGFGQAVEPGTDPATQSIRLATLANFSGVVVEATATPKPFAGGDAVYAENRLMPVMRRGRIYVTAGGAVDVGDEVVPSLGNNTKFTAGAGIALTKAYARTAAGADGDIFMIELVGP